MATKKRPTKKKVAGKGAARAGRSKASSATKTPTSPAQAQMKLYRALRHGAGDAAQARQQVVAARSAAAARTGWDDMQKAVESGNAARVRALVGSGVSPDVRSHFGASALHVAALEGQVEVVGVLLELGANVNQSNAEGETPLFGAAFRGNTAVVDLLLKHGARTDVVNQFKQSPADRATRGGHAALAKKLARAR